jgi:hypothetical protein
MVSLPEIENGFLAVVEIPKGFLVGFPNTMSAIGEGRFLFPTSIQKSSIQSIRF